MKVKVLASGSRGNVTAVNSGGKIILIDCGKPINWTLANLGYKLPDAILVTHEHCDHSKAVTSFLSRGVEVFMTAGTIQAMALRKRHNLHKIKPNATFKIDDVEILPISVTHDAEEPVNFILQDAEDRILYATDTGILPPIEGNFTQIFIEANYSEPELLNSSLDAWQKKRILENHLSIEQTTKFLRKYPKAAVELIHVSPRHGDAQKFNELIQEDRKCQSEQN